MAESLEGYELAKPNQAQIKATDELKAWMEKATMEHGPSVALCIMAGQMGGMMQLMIVHGAPEDETEKLVQLNMENGRATARAFAARKEKGN